jgi:hypothetical protein
VRRPDLSCLCAGVVAVLAAGVASAQIGNIVPGEQHAWAENAGWLDFRPADGGVTIGPSWVQGYAWAENLGWVKLGVDAGGPYANTSATNWGVNRDGAGNLSGFAWAENAGWIDFQPASGGVTIDPVTHKLDGYAWSENAGWIHFRGVGGGGAYGVAAQRAPAIPALALLGLLGLAAGVAGLGARGLRLRLA